MTKFTAIQAYTSQIAVMTMLALALGEDTISSRAKREAIIDDLLQLPRKCLLRRNTFRSNDYARAWYCDV